MRDRKDQMKHGDRHSPTAGAERAGVDPQQDRTRTQPTGEKSTDKAGKNNTKAPKR